MWGARGSPFWEVEAVVQEEEFSGAVQEVEADSDQAPEVDYDPVFVNSETGGRVC